MYYKISDEDNAAAAICKACCDLRLTSILIEGGAQLLQTFIQCGLWEEARIITNQQLYIGEGLTAPILSNHQLAGSEQLLSDRIDYFSNMHPQ